LSPSCLFQASAFVSDIGGALGLWIGLSFISVFEVVQLILELCRGIRCNPRITNKSRKGSTSSRGERNSLSNTNVSL